MLRIELLIDAGNQLGEGPLWDVGEQRLYWVDSYGNVVCRCDARGGERRSWPVPDHIGSMCLREQGGAVVALRSGFQFLDLESGEVTLIGDPEAGLLRTRLNDGKVDRQGRFVAGAMDYEERDGICGLYRLDPDLSITKLDDGIIVSNGPCWSPDGRTLYFADSFRRVIYAYDYLPARRHGRRPAHLCPFRGAARLSRRRHGRRGRLRLECRGVQRPADPLRP